MPKTECKAKDPTTCYYHSSQKKESRILEKLQKLLYKSVSPKDTEVLTYTPLTPETEQLLKSLQDIEPQQEHKISTLEEMIKKDRKNKLSKGNQALGFRYYPEWTSYTPRRENYLNLMEKANERLHNPTPQLTNPTSKLADRLGFSSQRLDKDTEILYRTYSYYMNEPELRNLPTYKMENYIIYRGSAVAYCEYAYTPTEEHMPPVLQGIEVREEYRGHQLSERLKLLLNSQLKTELHTDNIYTAAGAKHLSEYPVWEGTGVKNRYIVEGQRRFVTNWNILKSENINHF